jgi:hypothetical protein
VSDELEWVGEAYFRVLGYYFSLRWNAADLGEPVRTVLAPFGVAADAKERRIPPTPNTPPVYSLVRLKQALPPGYELLYGDGKLREADEVGDLLHHLFWHIGDEALRRTGSYLLVHAGAVALASGQCLVLPGDSGAGKTTLVAALVRAGLDYLSDEAAAIDPVSRRVFPFPRALALKSGSFSLFPDLPTAEGCVTAGDQCFVPPEMIRAGSVAGPGPVGWIVAIRHDPNASTELIELSAAEGVFELGRRAINLSLYGARALPLLADVARGARSFRLVSSDLAEAVDTLLALVGGDVVGASSERCRASE